MANNIYTTPGVNEDEIEMINTYSNDEGSKNQGGGGTIHPDPFG